MKIVLSLFMAVFAVALQSCNHSHRSLVLIPNTWSPSLTQVREFVDGIADKPSQINQRFLSDTSQTLADISDAQLFIVYVRIMQTLNDKERGILFDEQQRWLKTREQTAKAAVISQGGSLAPLEYNGVFRKMTEARLSKLLKQFNQAHIINDSTEEKKR